MSATRPLPIARDWLSKTVAGTLLGFTLAVLASAFYVHFAPPVSTSGVAQLAMWLVMPVWMGVLSLCFLFRNGWRAWAWLGGANLAGLALLLALRHF